MRVKILRLKFCDRDLQESQVKWNVNVVTVWQHFKNMSGAGGGKVNQHLHLFFFFLNLIFVNINL